MLLSRCRENLEVPGNFTAFCVGNGDLVKHMLGNCQGKILSVEKAVVNLNPVLQRIIRGHQVI